MNRGINTGKTQKTTGAQRTSKLRCRDYQPSPAQKVAVETRFHVERSRENRTVPHRIGHRHAGAVAIVPLPHHTPSDRAKTTESGPLAGCLAVTTAMTQRAGASPHPPLDLLLALVASQKTPHAGASPRPPQYSMSRIRSLNHHQDDEWCCPVFQDPHQTAKPCPPNDHISLRHPHNSLRRHTSKPSCRLRHLSTMYHTGVTKQG